MIDLTVLEENDWGTALARWTGPSKVKLEETDDNFLSVPNASVARWTGPSKVKLEESGDNSLPVPNVSVVKVDSYLSFLHTTI